jgi:hypothetical protein
MDMIDFRVVFLQLPTGQREALILFAAEGSRSASSSVTRVSAPRVCPKPGTLRRTGGNADSSFGTEPSVVKPTPSPIAATPAALEITTLRRVASGVMALMVILYPIIEAPSSLNSIGLKMKIQPQSSGDQCLVLTAVTPTCWPDNIWKRELQPQGAAAIRGTYLERGSGRGSRPSPSLRGPDAPSLFNLRSRLSYNERQIPTPAFGSDPAWSPLLG